MMENSIKLQPKLLSNLPDDCLGLILNLIPLENLIHLRRVCHRFDVLSKVVLRSKRYLKLARCQVQRSHCAHYPVKNLFAQRPLQGCRDDHVLMVPEDGGQGEQIDSCHEQIAQLLPNIRQLVAFTGRHTSSVRFELPAQLLPKWSTTLISLTIIQWSENSTNGKHESALDRLLLSTNSLICLKELNLLFFDSLTPSFKSANQFPVLAQLEQFTLHNFEGNNIEPILSQLGGKIRHLRVQLSNQNPESQTNKFSFAQLNHNFSTALTHLSFGTEILQTKSLTNLKALTYLDLSSLDFDKVNFEIINPDLFVEISKMKYQVELRLNIILLQIYFGKQQIERQNQSQIKYPCVPSIRHLRLRGHEQHFYNFTKYYSTLVQMLNSVEKIYAIKYCSKSMGLPTAEQANQITNRIRKYFGTHFSQNKVQLHVEFELNRNVLHYDASNLDFAELVESLSSHDTDRFEPRYMHEHNPKGVDDETTSEEDEEEYKFEDENDNDL